MAPNTRKGKTQLLESLPEGEFHDAQDFTDSTTALPARKRKPSQKQLEINEDQHATVSKKLEAMQKEYQKLKQQAKKMKAAQSREFAACRLHGTTLALLNVVDFLTVHRRHETAPLAGQLQRKNALLDETAPPPRSSAGRHQSAAQPPRPEKTHSRSKTAAPEPAHKDAPFLQGRAPTGKPKAGDYEPHVNRMIIKACHQYEVLIATEDPFPDLSTQDAWASRVWADVCNSTQVFYKLSDRIEKIYVTLTGQLLHQISGRDSHARGALRDKIRPHVTGTYGLLTDGSERSKTKNKERYDYLVDRDSTVPEPVFHYKDVEARTGFAHNTLVLRALQEQWFADASSPGIKYRTQFSPVREVTLAFIFTTIEFCLDQWTDGTFNKSHTFAEKFYKTRYELHLKQVRDWCATDPGAAQTVRQRLYDRVRRASGAAPVLAPRAGLSDSSKDRLRMELAAQAAASDSESDERQGGLQMGAGGEAR
ncbi:hypothetical protein BN946_scf185033.g9 [Trametes cinnabarina]|uniref:DUF6532 domain-containing protein n=1 Tax=Pycnoporus cinnabarinus TaxID=5643 RepID=A0A060SQM6_PYCCI|nr:hypothetical protein BN946_scf185033.g9 [Trametes cinnabarina]